MQVFFFLQTHLRLWKKPLKVVEVIANFAKRFSMNSKFNTLLWGIVIFFISSQIWIFLLKQSWFLRKVMSHVSCKSFEESLVISKLAKKSNLEILLSLTQCSEIPIVIYFFSSKMFDFFFLKTSSIEFWLL